MKKINLFKRQNGFTLAETLIALTVLGIIAAITIPALINKQNEASNRTKLKKAMTAYEKALNQMIIDNDIKSDISALNDATCSTTRPYFKTVENGGTNCQFKTADKIWWDISDIQNPVISLKDEITAANLATMKTNAESINTDKTTYAMIGYIDSDGVLRVNDLGVATDTANGIPTSKNRTYLTKIYGFMNAGGGNQGGGGEPETQKTNAEKLADCATSNAATCKVTYDCPTTEEPNKTCEYEMKKQTFTSTCSTLPDNSTIFHNEPSCPVKSGTNYAVMIGNNISWNDAQTACPEGTHLIKAAEIEQMYNHGAEGNALESLCDTCDRNSWPSYMVAEEDKTYWGAFYFKMDNSYGNLGPDTISPYLLAICVGD